MALSNTSTRADVSSLRAALPLCFHVRIAGSLPAHRRYCIVCFFFLGEFQLFQASKYATECMHLPLLPQMEILFLLTAIRLLPGALGFKIKVMKSCKHRVCKKYCIVFPDQFDCTSSPKSQIYTHDLAFLKVTRCDRKPNYHEFQVTRHRLNWFLTHH